MIVDPRPEPAEKKKKRWTRFDPKDPNSAINRQRAEE